MPRAFLVGGFLGSGKTTFVLNSLLPILKGERVCILVNDYGEISYDRIRFYQEGLEVLGIEGACMCCSGGNALLEVLRDLQEKCDTLLIETSGVSEVYPIWEAVESSGYTLEAVFCCLPSNIGKELLSLPIVRSQLEQAQCIVLTKVDLTDQRELLKILEHAKSFEKPLFLSYEGKVDASLKDFINLPKVKRAKEGSKPQGHDFYSEVIKLRGIYNKDELEEFLLKLPKGIYRAKGVVYTTHSPLPLGVNYTCGYISWERLYYTGEPFLTFIGTVPPDLYLMKFPQPIKDPKVLHRLLFPLTSFDRREGIAYMKGKVVSERRAVVETLKMLAKKKHLLITTGEEPFKAFASYTIEDYTYPKLLELLERLRSFKDGFLFFLGVPAGIVSLFIKELGESHKIAHVDLEYLLPEAYLSLRINSEEKLNTFLKLMKEALVY